MNKVIPTTYLIGYTDVDESSLKQYLKDTQNEDFMKDYIETVDNQNISPAECLCSFYAKLCYKSLTLGQNENVSKIRDIASNIKGCFDSGHGSVFEHVWFNFVTTNCSRVFTHELVRHRVGTAFSQTSGRYVRSDRLDMILDDPILHKYDAIDELSTMAEILEYRYKAICVSIFEKYPNMPFDEKKKLTSALRRILPNGQANEIGWSCNIRSLRHMVLMRTNKHAEWEIRKVFNDVYNLINNKFPLVFYGLEKTDTKDGLFEINESTRNT